MLCLQYQLQTSWGEPYEWAPRVVKYLNFDYKWPQILRFDPKVPIYRVPPNYFLIDIEDIATRVNPNVVLWLLCVIKWPKLWGFLHIWDHFWSEYGYLTPVVPIYRASSNFYAIDIKDIASRFNLNVFLWLLCVI